MNNTIFLKDELGNNVAFKFIDLVKYKDAEYVILIRADKPQSDEVVILKCEKDNSGDEETYMIVEDSFIYESVYMVFRKKIKKADVC